MDDELSAALALLDAPGLSREDCFPVPFRVHVQKVKDRLKGRDRRAAAAFIQADNARQLARALPVEEGNWLHGIIPGDFVFCDLLPVLIEMRGCPGRIDTQGMP